MAQSLGVPATFNADDERGVKEESAKVADNRAIAKLYDKTFKRLDSYNLAGTLNPQLRKAEIKTLGAEIERATTGRFQAGAASDQAEAMFPDAKDWGKARPQKYRNAMDHFKANEAGTINMDRHGLKTPFPFSAPAAAPGKDGEVRKSKSGKPMVFTGGKWIYKK